MYLFISYLHRTDFGVKEKVIVKITFSFRKTHPNVSKRETFNLYIVFLYVAVSNFSLSVFDQPTLVISLSARPVLFTSPVCPESCLCNTFT